MKINKDMKKIIILIFFAFNLISCTWDNKNIESKNEQSLEIQNFSEQFFDQISVSDFKNEMESDDIILLDVRTPWELVEYGKIRENQILININEKIFIDEIKKLDKTKKYLVYCWHGNRSKIAREYMKEQGFSYVKDLEWWIDKWVLEWESVLK